MNDERNGTQYAKLLHEKGFDNVYLLSGGIEGFLETHYDLVEGTNVPAKPKAKVATKNPSTAGISVMSSTTTSKFGMKKK